MANAQKEEIFVPGVIIEGLPKTLKEKFDSIQVETGCCLQIAGGADLKA